MAIMSEALPYYKTRAGKNQFASKALNHVNFQLHIILIIFLNYA
jgi:hypothetical protein